MLRGDNSPKIGPVLVSQEARVPRENHWPWASNW